MLTGDETLEFSMSVHAPTADLSSVLYVFRGIIVQYFLVSLSTVSYSIPDLASVWENAPACIP